ncbi:unnamed protein product [Spirodela intermedia]|uniref:Cardiolipin synthase N-terminal domain-containing protein n=1 Tax=Spirodela intermedia TaxID=51605 RepID=A0A7I8JKJ7_SPIIN|nr:unnamed protein product [Spirodela intermedia]CAA6670706.1 unnamed protein product [Spirodela intermedia]
MVLVSFSCNLTSCNFPSLPCVRRSKLGNPRGPSHPHYSNRLSLRRTFPCLNSGHLGPSPRPEELVSSCIAGISPRGELGRREPRRRSDGPRGGWGSGDGEEDWTTSVLLFALWAALVYYVAQLAPDQTPSRDMYFLQKLLSLKGDDGFRMNQVLVALWYVMGLWPMVYSMLLLPTGRSSRSRVPVWPFLLVSFFVGAYGLIPYFVLWKPPTPLSRKKKRGIVTASGLGLITYAGLASGEDWKEFFQYFRESKFVHVTSLDFSLLSAFSAFWVFNDMTERKWFDRGSWLLPVTLIPFVGPALYLLLRPHYQWPLPKLLPPLRPRKIRGAPEFPPLRALFFRGLPWGGGPKSFF